GHVEGVHHLLAGEGADRRVGAREGAVLEDWVVKQVRGSHGGLDAPVAERLLDVPQDLVALRRGRAEGEKVVVVKFKAVAVALGQAADTFERTQLRPGLLAERVAAAVLQAPNPEGEPILFRGGIKV